MAKFIDIGALWRAKEGAKSKASGTLDLDAIEELLDSPELKNEDKVRIFLKGVKSQKERAPDWQLTAVFGDEDEDRGRRRGRRSRRDEDDDRGRSSRRSSRKDEDDRDDYEATDEDVPF